MIIEKQYQVGTKWVKRGWEFTVLERKRKWAILQKTRVGKEIYSYEVVKIRWAPEKKQSWGCYSAGEYLPSNEEWGLYGWTYTTLQDANKKFEELIKNKRRIKEM